jgi:trigger factor
LRLKRAVLDKLAEGWDFAVPPGMVDIEFDNIWRQYQAQMASTQQDATIDAPSPAAEESGAATSPAAAEPDGSGASEEESKAEFRKIAERRVRLGLLLAEVGRRNNITVTPDEVNQAITREARRHPGYERQVLDFYRQNPGAIDTLRAPIFEDKVIDFIVELAKVGERKITPEELVAMPEPAGEDAVPG